MYLRYWQLQRDPFLPCTDAENFFWSTNRTEVYSRCKFAITNGMSPTLLTGETGTGKTSILELLMKEQSQVGHHTVLLDAKNIPGAKLLREFASALQIDCGDTDNYLPQLQEAVSQKKWSGKQIFLVLDQLEAVGHESWNVVEQLVSLANRLPEQLFVLLSVSSEGLFVEPPRSVVGSLRIEMDLLSPLEVSGYINQQMETAGGTGALFSEDAILLLHEATNGMPGLINRIGRVCLIAGAKSQAKMITRDVLKDVLQEIILPVNL